VSKQVEEILAPQKVEVYKSKLFPELEHAMLQCPDVLEIIGATQAQREQLCKITNESARQTREEQRKCDERVLAMLSPQQQTKLRAEVDREARAAETPYAYPGIEYCLSGIQVGPPAPPPPCPTYGSHAYAAYVTQYHTGWAAPCSSLNFEPSSSENMKATLPVYSELTLNAERRLLGFTAAQDKWLQAIADNYAKEEAQRAAQRPRGLTFEQWENKQPEFQQQDAEAVEQCRRQIETLLTAQQLATLKEERFCNGLRELSYRDDLGNTIGLTQQQSALIRQIDQEFRNSVSPAYWAAVEKWLAVPTEAQRQKLREELDRRAAW
jgi:hypothetical protein